MFSSISSFLFCPTCFLPGKSLSFTRQPHSQALLLPSPLPTPWIKKSSEGNLVLCAVFKQAAGTEELKEKKRPSRGITKAFPVSPAMQEFLGVAEIPRTPQVDLGTHQAAQPSGSTRQKVIVCDEKLKKIFAGRDCVGFLEISGLFNPHFKK